MITLEKIGKYEVTQKLGQGSFGVVYKGRDAYLKRDVAIKICSVEDEGLRKRFFREAEIAGKLVHENIVTVHEFGFEGDIPYLVQEVLSGEDLSPMVKRRAPLASATRIEYLLQVAKGLAYAHSEGVIHRDIKPANIRVLEDGRVKIMDFGIAKLASAETQLTQKGVTMGTASYLPPEQVRGSDLDHRADIFSFGVLAYELLTYERPFRGSTLSALVYQILYKVPQPMTDVWAECPEPLSDLIARCLDKKPEQRFNSFSELIPEMETIRDEVAAGKWPGLNADPPLPTLAIPPSDESEPSDVLSPTIISRTTQGVLEGKVGEYTISTVVSAEEVLRPPSSHAGHSTRPIAARSTEPLPTAPTSEAQAAKPRAAKIPTAKARVAKTRVAKTRVAKTRGAKPGPAEALPTEAIPVEASAPSPSSLSREDAALKTRVMPVSTMLPSSGGPQAPSNSLESDLTSTANEISELVAQGKLEAAKEQLEATINRQDLTGISALQAPVPAHPSAPKLVSGGGQPPASPQPPALPDVGHPPTSAASVVPADAAGSDTYRTVFRQPLDRRKWGAIAASATLALIILGWVSLRDSGTTPEELAEPELPVRAVAEPPATLQTNLGPLVINATPWAKVAEITNEEGYLQEIPEAAQTPMYLELPPGMYKVQLHDATGEDIQTCTVEISLEAVANCTPAFAETDATEYFKASGWWQ